MDRDTLIAALVGALIATIPIVISNIVQIILHLSDMRQREREAKRQAREKWLERDILTVMGMIENLAKLDLEDYILDSRLGSLEKKIDAGLPPEAEELRKELNAHRERADNVYVEVQQTVERINTLTRSFADIEILEKCTGFFDARITYAEGKREKNSDHRDWVMVGQKAGELHQALRDKLIAIRDS